MVELSKFLGERDISGLCCTKTSSTNFYLNWKESDACLYLQPLPLVATLYPFSALKHEYPASRSAAQLQSWGQKFIAEDGRAGREAVWNLVTSWTTCTRPRLLTPRIFHCLGKTDLSLRHAGLVFCCLQSNMFLIILGVFYLPLQVHVASFSTAEGLKRLACLGHMDRLAGPLVSGWTWTRNSTPMSLQRYILAKVHQDTFTRMVTTLLFVMAKYWKQTKCPSIGGEGC